MPGVLRCFAGMVITCLIVLVVTDAFCLCGPCYRITRSCSGDRILLGAGSYGKVYWGVLAWRDLPERRAWEKWVAVKTIILDKDSSMKRVTQVGVQMSLLYVEKIGGRKGTATLLCAQEVAILERTSNLPNVVGYHKCCRSLCSQVPKNEYHIVMELMTVGGDHSILRVQGGSQEPQVAYPCALLGCRVVH